MSERQPPDAPRPQSSANAAVRAKGTVFALLYRRLVTRLGHAQAIGAIAHRLCRLVWKILHERVRYEERGPEVSAQATQIPGLGVESAQQIIAEVGVTAATCRSARQLASWAGVCPGREESAGINYNPRCPKGNRQMRRVLNQAANAAARAKGTVVAVLYRRLVAQLGHAQAIGAIAHRLCRLVWKILHERVRYEERGPTVSAQATQIRTRKMIRALRALGYRVELPSPSNG